ncbi:MAG: hypothetical protein M1825_003100 [Sarcosagium campestre]|nr:MAG: hypothetical protein M1825_003100 [Sarcosagium campestre]
MTSITKPIISPAPQIHHFAGVLSDMDGTIVDSTQAIVRHWYRIGKELGVDPEVIMATSHGRRSIDTLKLYDEKLANWTYVSEIEGRIPRELGRDAKEIPGARKTLSDLNKVGAPWAIVTSGSHALVSGWLEVLALVQPKHLVVAEDVQNGKPDPECYRLGRSRLGLAEDASVLVLEDSPAGVIAGKRAGCKVLALTTTHPAEQMRQANPDWIVPDLQSISVLDRNEKTGLIEIEIRDTLPN